ncbi:MAG: hypothetical protein RL708_83 [Bacteroidota bacterium]|jgi:hypothetical protein
MNYSCKVTIAPLRAEPSHKAEMVSQILFGENVLQINQQNEWIKVACSYDGYEGWVELKSLIPISDDILTDFERHIVMAESNLIEKKSLNILRIVSGSEIYLNRNKESIIGNKIFDFAGHSILKNLGSKINVEAIIQNAVQFLNVPYLWGGKSMYGIDCSGFTQLVYKLNNFYLPRDAYQQAEVGNTIQFGKQQTGDLAFFINQNNKISHVGICINDNEIIHCSAFVRIDTLNENGILNEEENILTHQLSIIKRVA